jgi:hypothetical protein
MWPYCRHSRPDVTMVPHVSTLAPLSSIHAFPERQEFSISTNSKGN